MIGKWVNDFLAGIRQRPPSPEGVIVKDNEILVPKVATLDGFTDALASNQGVLLRDVPFQTVLEIQTQNSVYAIVVLDLVGKEVLMRGGKFLPKLTNCTFSGSSIQGGSFLKTGWIGVGMGMEFRKSAELEKPIITSPVQKINVVTSANTTIQ